MNRVPYEPESGDYAREPQYHHVSVNDDNGGVVEVVEELTKEEILSPRHFVSPVANEGVKYLSPLYRDSFDQIDELESNVDKINPEDFKNSKK